MYLLCLCASDETLSRVLCDSPASLGFLVVRKSGYARQLAIGGEVFFICLFLRCPVHHNNTVCAPPGFVFRPPRRLGRPLSVRRRALGHYRAESRRGEGHGFLGEK